VVPRDAFGRKLYLQPLGLLLEVRVRVGLARAAARGG
jgi:hypothetical protein